MSLESRGGRYFGGKKMEDPRTTIGGEIEPTEITNIFDTVNTFEGIINLVRNAPSGSLRDSQGNEINPIPVFQAKTLSEEGKVVTKNVIEFITRKNGLREAVIRAISPNFENDTSFFEIMTKLKMVVEQNKELEGLLDSQKQSLSVLKGSSGNSVDAANYVKILENILESINNGVNIDIIKNFATQLTGNQGLRDAVNRAIDKATSR